jgi:riboflavin kinase/FMN adenylyltransferase
MDVLHGLESLPQSTGGSVVTIGMFDGVHRGHQAVIGRTVDRARATGLRSVTATFDRHPRETLTPGREPRLLTTLERKISLIAQLGVDLLLVLPFTEELSRIPAEQFVTRVLAEGLQTRRVVIGTNFTFGHKARGNLDLLTAMAPAHGFTVDGVDLLELDGRRVSSSSIREGLIEGDLGWPQTALGRRFVLDGRVVRGAGRGADLGWPTANLQTDHRLLLPGEGVYAGRARAARGDYVAAINVGSNPTFGREPVHVEAFLLDFEGTLLGEEVAVEFWVRLRDEVRFESAEELAKQIAADVERTRELMA